MFHKVLRFLSPYCVLVAVLAGVWSAGEQFAAGRTVLWAPPMALLVGLCLALPRARRVVLGGVRWFTTMQAAVVVATANGVRGRWDVWRR
jgi:hypothetical protein